MAAGNGELLLRFLLLLSFVLGALCCSCARTHPQEQFCHHEYVMKVHIKRHMTDRTTFVMEMQKLYKGDSKKLKFKLGRLLVLTMPTFCAIDFMKPGDTYVIFGSNSKGNIFTNLCSGSVNWQEASNIFRRGLANKYNTGCDCVGHAGSYDECRWRYSYLQKRGQRCVWAKSKSFERCQKITPISGNSRCWI